MTMPGRGATGLSEMPRLIPAVMVTQDEAAAPARAAIEGGRGECPPWIFSRALLTS